MRRPSGPNGETLKRHDLPDGTLSTDLPDPTVPAVIGGVPVWPFPHMPKQEDPAGDVPDGAMWRSTVSKMYFRRGDDGELLVWSVGTGTWRISTRERSGIDLSDFIRIAAPPVALRVGDRVRLLFASQMFGYHAGQVLVVSKIGDSGLFWTADDPDGSPLSTPEEEGESWERVA